MIGSWGNGEQKIQFNGYGISVWENEDVWVVVTVVQQCEFINVNELYTSFCPSTHSLDQGFQTLEAILTQQ